MKCLTLHQPWASLVSIGVKSIETRSWSTTYRGPLAIHAAKKWPVPVHDWQVPADRSSTVGAPCVERLVNPADPFTRRWEMLHTPLGVVVAVCDLVDVVPIKTTPLAKPTVHGERIIASGVECVARLDESRCDLEWRAGGLDVVGNLPFGDFAPGRFAWLLDNVRPLTEPFPMKGGQGLRRVPDDMAREIERCAS